MANTITKFQATYLKDRLDDIKHEKLKEFEKANKPEKLEELEYYYNLIKSGEVKLKAYKEIKGKHSWGKPNISELFDTVKADEDYDKPEQDYNKKEEAYRTKLEKAITSIVDSVVLQGLGIEEAIAKFKAM